MEVPLRAQVLKSCALLLLPDSMTTCYTPGTVLRSQGEQDRKAPVLPELLSWRVGWESKQPGRVWALGGNMQVLRENSERMGQARLPSEVVPKVSF